MNPILAIKKSKLPSYKTNDPVGWVGDKNRGAALGRVSRHLDNLKSFTGKLYIRRIILNNGGYDINGTYFGHGEPLYWVANSDCTIDFMCRSHNRNEACKKVHETYPNAKITNWKKNV